MLLSSLAPARRVLLLGSALALAAMLVLPFAAQSFVVPTVSMESTLLAGDHLIVGLHARSPVQGQLITFQSPVDPGHTFLKRVVGLPGDRIRLVHKTLYRNGAVVNEPFVQHTTTFLDSYRDEFPAAPNVPLPDAANRMLNEHRSGQEIVVPSGHYFVLGDNRDNSLDSRYFGFVPASAVRGRPLFVYWSKDPNGGTRWARTFQSIR